MGNLIGKLSSPGSLIGKLSPVGNLIGILSIDDKALKGILTIPKDIMPPSYNGENLIIQS